MREYMSNLFLAALRALNHVCPGHAFQNHFPDLVLIYSDLSDREQPVNEGNACCLPEYLSPSPLGPHHREMVMSDAIKGLSPEPLWDFFARIAAIPHGSKNETALGAHLRLIAEKAGLTVRQDEAGNLCIAVPPSPGCEKAPAVVLQAHLDMVCEKNASITFDFTRDAIRLVRDRDWMKADGTSLGADNGIGMAAAMAVALSKDILHGPIEVLLTVDEETGLTGAVNLSPSLVRGRILLNLDSEKSDHLCIGCAGGGEISTLIQVWTFMKTAPMRSM